MGVTLTRDYLHHLKKKNYSRKIQNEVGDHKAGRRQSWDWNQVSRPHTSCSYRVFSTGQFNKPQRQTCGTRAALQNDKDKAPMVSPDPTQSLSHTLALVIPSRAFDFIDH